MSTSTQTFQEHEHPRGAGGKFATKPAQEATAGLDTAPTDQQVMTGALTELGIDPECITTEDNGVSIQPKTDSGMALYIERTGEGYTVYQKTWGGVGPDSWDEEHELYRGENRDADLDVVLTEAADRALQASEHGWDVAAPTDEAAPEPEPHWGVPAPVDHGDYGPPPF